MATDITEQKGLELGLKELNQTLENRVEEEIRKRREMATMNKMIIETHMSGTIDVKNSELGATFTIKMPIYLPEPTVR